MTASVKTARQPATDPAHAATFLGPQLHAVLAYGRDLLLTPVRGVRILSDWRRLRSLDRPPHAPALAAPEPPSDQPGKLSAVASLSARYAGVVTHPASVETSDVFVSRSALTDGLRLVRMADDRVAIEKSVADRSEKGSKTWLNEILFYAYLRDRISDDIIHIPELLAVDLDSDRSARLTLTYAPDTRPLSSFESGLAAAEAFGEMAAKAHVTRAFDAPWLPRARSVRRLEPDRHATLQRLFGLIGRESHYDRVLALLQHEADMYRAYKLGLETICHCDANRDNVRERADGSGYLVVDWANVSRGMIGHDLARLALPRLLWDARWTTFDAMMAAEADLLKAYLSGVEKHLPGIDRRAVGRCFELASVSLALRLYAGTAVPKITTETDDGRQAFWIERIRAYYDHLLDRTEAIVTEHKRSSPGRNAGRPTAH